MTPIAPRMRTTAEMSSEDTVVPATGGLNGLLQLLFSFGLALPAAGRPLLPGLQALICAGAPTHPEEKRAALERLTPNLFEIYGTVGTGPITVLRPEEMAAHAESAGRPAGVWELEIVDEADRALPKGVAGRLRLRGPAVAAGAESGTTAGSEAIRDGWYYSGEIAALDPDGFLLLKGRATDVILRGGSNVYPDGKLKATTPWPVTPRCDTRAR